MEPLGVVVLIALVGTGIGLLVWRDRRRGPVCPHCGRPNTFGPSGQADVCSNCEFDFRTDDH
jgi:NADH pyrophosphatase NudC (nudix superfamily)